MLNETLTPAAAQSPDEIHARYPARSLPEGASVTRVGPSPTGFMHVGGLYAALISSRLAKQTDGVFYLRIEDTDKKREVEGAVDLIVDSLAWFSLVPDEGEVAIGVEQGEYGPYRQSGRTALYQTFARVLLDQGNAYPCFATAEELEAARKEQTLLKIPPGYYGRWATWRDRPAADVEAALAEGKPFVIRLRTPDNQPERIALPDSIRGELEFPPNASDIVLLKADGTPTYHLAHVVDDHLMGTTDVVRGDEWLSSYPLHRQLFGMFGWQPPRYAHIAPIEKIAGSSRRKLSKRHDPEASVSFYIEQGYPPESLFEYLINLADSRFEDWREANETADARSFAIAVDKMSRSGALFDMVKLESVSRNVVGRMSAATIYDAALAWAAVYDADFAALFAADRDYALAILDIERHAERPRKDIVKWSDLPADIGYFFDARFAAMQPQVAELLTGLEPRPEVAMLREIAEQYDPSLSRDDWLNWLRAIGERYGYALNAKTFKADKEAWRGHFGDLAAALRIALTARKNTPDLHEVMGVLGGERVKARIAGACGLLG